MNMNQFHLGRWGVCLVIAAIVCWAGTWTYAKRVLIPEQRDYCAAHGLPRARFSDLYPRWIGAREVLLHGRDPYTMEVTREIQTGLYGQPLAPDRHGHGQNYQQGFYYPLYISFFLAPTFHLPFQSVQAGFSWMLFTLTIITIPLWLRLLRWPVPLWMQAVIIVFAIGSLPFMQALRLQQITLVAAFLVASAMLCLGSGCELAAGILLALSTIKPQLVWLVLLWLAIWTLADWRRRYRWALSFFCSMAILCAASEYYLPHWIFRFWQSIREYHSYTGEMSVSEMLIGPWSRIWELLALGLMAAVCWISRHAQADSEAFAFVTSLVLAVTVLVVPSYGPYNQPLLMPAILILLRDRQTIWRKSAANRLLLLILIVLLVWPWLACVVLSGLSFILPLQTVEKGSLMPVWTLLLIPVAVAAAMLVYAGQRTFTTSRGAPTS
ncbi:MAG: glycosyltransferase family 87 protein [Terriglobales bacterium]